MSGRPTFDAGFSTLATAEIFSAASTVAAILDFEAALALALADVGIAPVDEADQVATACQYQPDDPEAILGTWWRVGTPIPALRDQVIGRIEVEAARRWFHFGTTTQDACDTAASLQSRKALDAIELDLMALARRLRELAIAHRELPQMGRTFLRDARVTTFGLRTAVWLDDILDVIDDLRRERDGLAVQLGGPTGTRAEYGSSGTELTDALAGRLGLVAAASHWHGRRGHVLRRAHALERTARSCAKIATDVALLASDSIGEVRVRSGKSSSMPGKENPIDSVRTIAAASVCAGAVAMLGSAPPVELDRGLGGWHVEWVALPLAFQSAAAAAEAMNGCLASLEVRSEVMASGVADTDLDAVLAGAGAQIDSVLVRFDERA